MEKIRKVTKVQQKLFIKKALSINPKTAQRALLKVYEFQTDEEQQIGDTSSLNGIGFTGADGEILSSFSEQLIHKGYLSPKQMTIVMKKMSKYWSQILMVSDIEKLNEQIRKSIVN